LLCVTIAGCFYIRVSDGRFSVHVMLSRRDGKAGLHKPHFSGCISNRVEMGRMNRELKGVEASG
jgi:hypothetical protein